jgi:hypothetical protein
MPFKKESVTYLLKDLGGVEVLALWHSVEGTTEPLITFSNLKVIML